MRHYEAVLIIHPDQSEQVNTMVDRYKNLLQQNGGKIHRFEDWGRLVLAYPIEKCVKGHYVCINFEVNQDTLNEFENNLKFNDAVLRHLTVKTKTAETEPSAMYLSINENNK